MSNRKKNQHYIPQFYLGRFATDPMVDRDKRHIYVFDKVKNEQRVQRVAQVAFERFFNDLPVAILPPEFGPDVQEPEEILSQVEGNHQAILTRTLERVEAGKAWMLKQSDKYELAAVVAVMYLRTAAYRKVIREGLQQCNDDLIQAHAERDIAPYINGGVPEADELRDLLARNIHQVHLHNPASAGGQAENYATLLNQQFAWLVCKNETQIPLYTSDNPFQYVCFSDANGASEKTEYATIRADGVIAAIPLSPRYAIVMYNRNGFPNMVPLEGQIRTWDDDEVTFWNEAQVRGSERLIFCNKNSFEVVRHILKTYPQYSDSPAERAPRYAPLFTRINSELQHSIDQLHPK